MEGIQMASSDVMANASYLTIVVGEKLQEHYNPTDIVTLAEAVNADILTVGEPEHILPDGTETSCYLGPLDDNYDAISVADVHITVGVGIKAAQDVPWSVFTGNSIVMTKHSSQVYCQSVDNVQSNWLIVNADSDKLHAVAKDTRKLATPSEPSTVYSPSENHPDPPIELATEYRSSVEVKRCEVCHTVSNHKVSIGGGFPGPAIEWECPGVLHRNHDYLELLIKRRDRFDRRRALYDENTETGQRALDRVEEKERELEKKIESLRDWFDGRFDDVIEVGEDVTDDGQYSEFEPREITYDSK